MHSQAYEFICKWRLLPVATGGIKATSKFCLPVVNGSHRPENYKGDNRQRISRVTVQKLQL